MTFRHLVLKKEDCQKEKHGGFISCCKITESDEEKTRKGSVQIESVTGWSAPARRSCLCCLLCFRVAYQHQHQRMQMHPGDQMQQYHTQQQAYDPQQMQQYHQQAQQYYHPQQYSVSGKVSSTIPS